MDHPFRRVPEATATRIGRGRNTTHEGERTFYQSHDDIRDLFRQDRTFYLPSADRSAAGRREGGRLSGDDLRLPFGQAHDEVTRGGLGWFDRFHSYD
ncbi:hypothetical protein V1634_28230 [Plantactinospora veratri]|uniref:Uncharacterized protein n=1 Tax=Plantactinospora veratri TaxID=1436122 RepID=A0ABU7SLG9_9ACTN